MQFQIFRACETDVGEVVRLNGVVQDVHVGLRPDVFRADWDESTLRETWLERIKEETGTIALCKKGARTIGYIWFEIRDRQEDALTQSARRLFVHHIAVEDEARGGGVGARLMHFVETEASRLGATDIVLDAWAANTGALAFFDALDYQAVRIILAKTIR